jgi:hypothetical protein
VFPAQKSRKSNKNGKFMPHPSDSTIQTTIEQKIYRWFLTNNDNLLSNKNHLEIDGQKIEPDINCFNAKGQLIVGEIFVRTKTAKAGQKKKIAADILKLISFKQFNNTGYEVILVLLLERDLHSKFTKSNSWLNKVCFLWGVQLKHYELTAIELKDLELINDRQAEGNRVTKTTSM